MTAAATVAIGVMAHPTRKHLVDDLTARLDTTPTIVFDVHPRPSSDPSRRWTTARRAWQATAEHNTTWCVLLQDDCVPADDLHAALTRMLTHVPPDTVVSLYFGRRRPDRNRCEHAAQLAGHHDASFIRLPELLWGVAIAAPTSTVDGMLEQCSKPRYQRTAYDKRVGVHYRKHGYQTLCTWPSLVDHRTGPSLCGPRDPARTAHHAHTGSALELDWTGPVVDATRTPPRLQLDNITAG